MKFTKKQIDEYLNRKSIELSEEELKSDFVFDEKFGFITIHGEKMVYLKSTDGSCWIRIAYDDLSDKQKDAIFVNEEELDRMANEYVSKYKKFDRKIAIEIFKAGFNAISDNIKRK